LPAGSGAVLAVRPPLQIGDLLVLEEIRSPIDGSEAAADRTHRAVVRISDVEDASDPLFSATLTSGVLAVSQAPGDELPLLHVSWERAEALRFPLCISARTSQ